MSTNASILASLAVHAALAGALWCLPFDDRERSTPPTAALPRGTQGADVRISLVWPTAVVPATLRQPPAAPRVQASPEALKPLAVSPVRPPRRTDRQPQAPPEPAPPADARTQAPPLPDPLPSACPIRTMALLDPAPPPAPPELAPLEPQPLKAELPAASADEAPTPRLDRTQPPTPTPPGHAGVDNGAILRLRPHPIYPASSIRLGQQGTVLLELLVLPSGRVGEVRVLKSSGYVQLDEAAVAAMRRAEFRPARREGEPVEARVVQPVQFVLK